MTISLAKFCRNKNRWWERWGTWSWSEENTENFFYQHTELAVRLHVEHKFPPSSGGSRVHLHLVFQLWPVFFLYLWTKSFPLSSDSDLHDVFDQRLVGADLGALQSTDTVSDPGDERELGPFAHGVSCCESEEAEQTSVVWRKRGKRKGQGQRSKGNRVSFLPELSLT